MAKESTAVHVLVVSRNVASSEFLCQQMQQLAIEAETSCDAATCTGKLCRAKFEGVIVDMELEGAVPLLKRLRELTSHRHVISFAIVRTGQDAATAFKAHANFVIQHPLSAPSVTRVFRAAYPLMVRERRRYYRHQIEGKTFVKAEGEPELLAYSVNISETGMAVDAPRPLPVGTPVELQVDLPGLSEPLVIAAEVCWVNASNRTGLHFAEVTPDTAERLLSWLSDRMSELVPGW